MRGATKVNLLEEKSYLKMIFFRCFQVVGFCWTLRGILFGFSDRVLSAICQVVCNFYRDCDCSHFSVYCIWVSSTTWFLKNINQCTVFLWLNNFGYLNPENENAIKKLNFFFSLSLDAKIVKAITRRALSVLF